MTDELMKAYKGLEAKQAAEKKARQEKMDKVGNGCLITIGLFILFIVIASNSPDQGIDPPSQAKREKPSIKRRTSTGVPIERGADIDYRIDSDKIINLSVNRIRSRGYRCNSVSRIQLYKYPDRISVYCNDDKDRYWIKRDSAGLFRHVERL